MGIYIELLREWMQAEYLAAERQEGQSEEQKTTENGSS